MRPQLNNNTSNAGFLLAFTGILALCVLPLTIIYILAIARAGQDLAGIYSKCGNAFYPFVIANCAFNWLLAIALALGFVWLWTFFLHYNINNVECGRLITRLKIGKYNEKCTVNGIRKRGYEFIKYLGANDEV